MDALEIACVAKSDAQEVIRGAGQEVAFDDFGVTAHIVLESVEHRAPLLFERDGDERRARKSCDVGVEQHDIAGDETALLEQADASQAGGRRKMNPVGELEVGQPSVAHQGAQDRAIAFVDFVWSHNPSRFVRIAAFHAKFSLPRSDFGYTFRGFEPTLPHQRKEMVRCSSECPEKSRTTSFASDLRPPRWPS